MLPPNEITKLLNEWSHGDDEAMERLTPLLYEELRRIAGSYLRSERSDHTLQATAIVHEAYLSVREMRHFSWQNRGHFVGVMANLMRRALVDYARQHNAQKRSGELYKVSLSHAEFIAETEETVDLIFLNDALDKFSVEFPRQAKVVELKFFGGLTIDEIAEVLGADEQKVSTATIERDWRFARAWLHSELSIN